MNKKRIFIDACKKQGWIVNVCKINNEIIADFEQYTPAGEDFCFSAAGKDFIDLITDIQDFTNCFDPEEHAAECYNMPGAPGLRELLDDAEYIKDKMLDPLYYALDRIYIDIINNMEA